MQEAAQLASAIERLGKELAESENAKMHAIEDASCKDAKLTELSAVVDKLTQRALGLVKEKQELEAEIQRTNPQILDLAQQKGMCVIALQKAQSSSKDAAQEVAEERAAWKSEEKRLKKCDCQVFGRARMDQKRTREY